jgi:hypothetical protein
VLGLGGEVLVIAERLLIARGDDLAYAAGVGNAGKSGGGCGLIDCRSERGNGRGAAAAMRGQALGGELLQVGGAAGAGDKKALWLGYWVALGRAAHSSCT